MVESVKEQFPPSVKTGIDSIARHIARPIRGCATVDQYTDVVTRATDALNAAAETLVRASWQPIETVPKDGTNVLLVWQWDSGLHKGVAVVLAAWRCRAHLFLSSHFDCPNEAGCDMNWDSYGGRMTHWMLLPDPPTSE